MLYRRKRLWKLIALVECMSSRWHIFQYFVFYWKTCLTGEHVLLEGMCYSGTHVVVVVMSFMRICVWGGHVS